jgi:D-aminoacyl-tRNA deacylase
LVLVSRADAASLTIRDALLATAAWEEVGRFQDAPVRRHGDFLMAETETLHLHCDGIDAQLRAAGFPHDTLLFASRHRAESGKPALTVHPIGNWGDAALGGKPRAVSPAAPPAMGRILRRLHAETKGIRHEATLEATHHGPHVETPAAFVEIGTDEAAWADADLGLRVARAILASRTPGPGDDAPVLVALGGPHYAPRVSDLVRKGKLNVGHVVPAYALERGVDPATVLDAIRGTAGCQGYFALEKDAAALPADIKQVFAALELGWWREGDL